MNSYNPIFGINRHSANLFAIAKMNQVIGYLKYLRKVERKIKND